MNKIIKRWLTQAQTFYFQGYLCATAVMLAQSVTAAPTPSWQTLVVVLDRVACKCGQQIFYRLFGLPFTLTTPRLPLPAESIWNAASFYQESSYLYFPTLQAELASDISFYFKSSAPSGVFLENLGLKDFIRLELTCESTFLALIGLPKKKRARNTRQGHGRRMRAGTGAIRRAVRWFYYFASSQEARAGMSLTVSFPQEVCTLSGPRSMM